MSLLRRQQRKGYRPGYPTLSRRRFIVSTGVVVIGGVVLGRPSAGSTDPDKPSATELRDGSFRVELPAALRELQLDGGPIYYRVVLVVGAADVAAFIEQNAAALLEKIDGVLRRYPYDNFQTSDASGEIAAACLKVLTDAYRVSAPSDFLSIELVVEHSPYDTLAGCSCASVPW